MKFELPEALYRLGELGPERLGDVGVVLLETGRDTPAVRQLAALGASATWRDVDDLLDRVLTELARSGSHRVGSTAPHADRGCLRRRGSSRDGHRSSRS